MGGAVPAEPAPSPTPPEPGSSAEGQDQKRGKGPRPPLGESSVQGKRIFPSFLHALSSPSQTKGLQENFSSRPRGLRGGGGGGDRPSFPAGLSELQHRRAHLAHCRSGAQRGSLGVYSGSQEVFSLSREKQCLACGPWNWRASLNMGSIPEVGEGCCWRGSGGKNEARWDKKGDQPHPILVLLRPQKGRGEPQALLWLCVKELLPMDGAPNSEKETGPGYSGALPPAPDTHTQNLLRNHWELGRDNREARDTLPPPTGQPLKETSVP